MCHSFGGFSSGSSVKSLPTIQKPQETLWVQSLGQEDPLEESMQPTLVFSCLENPMDKGAWWTRVRKELDMTEAAHTHTTVFVSISLSKGILLPGFSNDE